jgi:hypothetical protein
MADIDEVLSRLADAEFRAHLVRDPKTALAGYDLTTEDLDRLATEVGTATLGPVEQRVSRAGFLALFCERLE